MRPVFLRPLGTWLHSTGLKQWLKPLSGLVRSAAIATVSAGIVSQGLAIVPARAEAASFCQQTPEAIAEKERLLAASLRGERGAEKRYKALLAQQGDRLRQCRKKNWPQTEAIWIRLYPCDTRPGALDAVLDRIVNRGYNQVHIEVFASSKVLLPANANPTPWQSVLAGSRNPNTDLLAQAIRKGRERGLKVYAWLFTLNFGINYFSRSDRRQTFARNGLGQDSLSAHGAGGLSASGATVSSEEAFVDPYSPQARQDFLQLVQAIAQRKPDGMLFDYVRYPRGVGASSVTSKVQDLWIYGEASRNVLLRRGMNYKGMELIQRYLNQGFITAEDLKDANLLYPKEKEPLWQGRNPGNTAKLPLGKQVAILQAELWQLTVAHAFQGVYEFLNTAVAPVQRAGIPAGVVFFPDGNQVVGGGFDSRLQFWEYFPRSLEWHPMSYGVCGNVSCIVNQVQRVLSATPKGTQVKPVLAGIWQESVSNRPPLEAQMQAIYRLAPQLQTVSHFAYSWQEPGSDRDRKYCQP